MKKYTKHVIFLVISFILIFLTVRTILTLNDRMTVRDVVTEMRKGSPLVFLAAFFVMLGFIFFEGIAIRLLLRAFDHSCSLSDGILYGSSDTYFSAITPTASGGQPACAFFMVKRGISAEVITVVLLVNLMACTVSTFITGVMVFILRPALFLRLTLFSRVFIIGGMATLLALVLLFFGLLRHNRLMRKVGSRLIHLLAVIKLVRNEEEKQAAFLAYTERYLDCAKKCASKKKVLLLVLLFDLLHRLSKSVVVLLIFLAMKGRGEGGLSVWASSVYSQLGSNCVPLPGGVGVADYILLDGLKTIFPSKDAASLEIVSTVFSQYFCVALGGIITAAAYLGGKRKEKS